MTTYFRLRTAHGGTVALDQRLGVLVASTPPLPLGTAQVVMCRLPSRPGIILLTTEGHESSQFCIHPLSDRKSSVMFFRAVGEQPLALMHPMLGKFVTATPERHGPLHNTADIIRAWELFAAEPVQSITIPTQIADRVKKADSFLGSTLTVDRVIGLLSEGRASTDLLNAAIPLLPTDLLDKLAEHFIADGDSRRRLAQASFSDVWASSALPELAAWLDRTRAVSGQNEPPTVADQRSNRFLSRWIKRRAEPPQVTSIAAEQPPARREIGPELDSLGTTALTGGFVSLPHACTLRARRVATPRKEIAIVATARNEGIYLLEWIAYHRRLGVEAFYIYSNDNDDGSDKLLAALAEARIITWISSKLEPGVGNAQFKAYGHALSYMPDLLDYYWALLIDLDEFLVLDRGIFPSVVDFCNWHKDRGADTVAINWAFLRSEEIPVRSKLPLTHRNQRLLTATEMGEGVRLVKSMSRPNRVCHSEAHVPFADERSGLVHFHASGRPHSWHNPATGFAPSPKFSDSIIDDVAVIYHYIFKSSHEWLWKSARNPGDHRLVSNGAFEPMSESKARHFLVQHDAQNLVMTQRATESVPDLVQEISGLRALPGIEATYLDVLRRYEEKLAAIKSAYMRSPEVKAWDENTRRFLQLASIQ